MGAEDKREGGGGFRFVVAHGGGTGFLEVAGAREHGEPGIEGEGLPDSAEVGGGPRCLRSRPQFKSASFQYFVPCSVAWRATPFFVNW